MREIAPGNLYAVFQPHGYKPFGFMRDQLFLYLDEFLRPKDRFILLTPFYAGRDFELFADGGRGRRRLEKPDQPSRTVHGVP